RQLEDGNPLDVLDHLLLRRFGHCSLLQSFRLKAEATRSIRIAVASAFRRKHPLPFSSSPPAPGRSSDRAARRSARGQSAASAPGAGTGTSRTSPACPAVT